MNDIFTKIIEYFLLNETESYFPETFNKNTLSYKLYIISSFSYLFLAIFQLTIFKNTIPALTNILFIQSICLIIQSIFTYYADVINIGKKSNWHIFDRLIAIINIIFIFSNIIWLPNIDIIIYMTSILSGLILIKKSRFVRKKKDFRSFIFYHSLWHIWFPMSLFLWLLYNKIDNEKYKSIVLFIIFISNFYIIGNHGIS